MHSQTRFFILITLLTGSLIHLPCNAAQTLATRLTELEQKHRNLQSLSAEFVQGRKDPFLKKPVVKSGKIWLQKDHVAADQVPAWKIRLEILKPEHTIFIYQGETMTVIDPVAHHQRQIAQALPVQDHLPISIFTAKALRTDYLQSISLEEVRKFLETTGSRDIKIKGYWLSMKDPLFSSKQGYLLRLHEKLGIPDCFLWQDAAGLQHWVELKKIISNEPIGSDYFAQGAVAPANP